MPYFIENDNPDCNGWAVVDQGGDVFGCHTTKQAAIDQAVAISISDDEPFEGERNLDGDPIIICDIDDTLISGGELVQRVWDYVQSLDGALFIVSGRNESQRDITVQQLESLGVRYSELILNDGSTADSAEFKRDTAIRLLETYNVVEAVENDDDTRDYYRELGIKATDPSDIGRMDDEGDGMDDSGDDMRSSKAIETRVSAQRIEVREGSDGMMFEGYAAVFDSPSEPLPFIERIAPGAFTRSLKSRNDVKLLWNHDTSQVLGSTRAKTLTLIEDNHGLKVRGVLPNTTAGRDAAELLKRGDVDSMSFGFTVISDEWASSNERVLKSVRLHEVSIVAFPAYSATAGTTSVRNLDKVVERTLVDADMLSAALNKIEAGEDITQDDRDILSKVIDELAPDETVEVSGDMLALAKAKLKVILL